MDDQRHRERLAQLRMLADVLDPDSAEDELGRARIEAYQAGIRFALDFLEGGGDAEVIPLPRGD